MRILCLYHPCHSSLPLDLVAGVRPQHALGQARSITQEEKPSFQRELLVFACLHWSEPEVYDSVGFSGLLLDWGGLGPHLPRVHLPEILNSVSWFTQVGLIPLVADSTCWLF